MSLFSKQILPPSWSDLLAASVRSERQKERDWVWEESIHLVEKQTKLGCWY